MSNPAQPALPQLWGVLFLSSIFEKDGFLTKKKWLFFIVTAKWRQADPDPQEQSDNLLYFIIHDPYVT